MSPLAIDSMIFMLPVAAMDCSGPRPPAISAAGPQQEVKVSLKEPACAAEGFIGEMEWQPPKFSAEKIAGVPADKLARQHQGVDLTKEIKRSSAPK